jgi:hypothetical protein
MLYDDGMADVLAFARLAEVIRGGARALTEPRGTVALDRYARRLGSGHDGRAEDLAADAGHVYVLWSAIHRRVPGSGLRLSSESWTAPVPSDWSRAVQKPAPVRVLRVDNGAKAPTIVCGVDEGGQGGAHRRGFDGHLLDRRDGPYEVQRGPQVAETRVYFEDVSHGGRLHSVSKDGGPVEIVDTGGYKVGGGLAAAHGIVYLAGYSNGADHTEVYDVLKIPASGGAAQRIGYGEDGDIVKDGNALYVAERTTGRVVRFAIE